MTLTSDDVRLHAGERGMLLGETRTGKSTAASQLIGWFGEDYQSSFTLIADTKPRFKAARELDGRPTSISGRYRQQDWGEEIPNSVVLPLRNPRQEIRMARQLKYKVAIAQIPRRTRENLGLVGYAMQYAYEDRPPKKPLLIYIDEMNNFFRLSSAPPSAKETIVMIITSGGERSVAFLGAAQRPRNISVEALESLTKLYWFHTPFGEDVKHLKNMGVPDTARPPEQFYRFYFFDKYTRREGMAMLSLKKNGEKK